MTAPKYDTLAQLQDGYACGQLARTSPLIIDNDETYVYTGDPDYDDTDQVFQMHPGDLLMQALDLLGIPYEGV